MHRLLELLSRLMWYNCLHRLAGTPLSLLVSSSEHPRSWQPTWSGPTNHTELLKELSFLDVKRNTGTNLLLKYTQPIPLSEAWSSSSPKPLTEDIAVFKIRLIDISGSCFPLSQNSCAKLILTGLKLPQHFLSLAMNAIFFPTVKEFCSSKRYFMFSHLIIHSG